MSNIPRVKAGDAITEGLLNRIVDQFERFANLRSDSPHVRIDSGPHGKLIELDLPQPTWALLSGSTSPYSWTEVYEGPSGTWPAMPSGDSGTAYEANAKSGLAGKVVPITWTSAGDWRFQYIGYGCGWTFNVLDLCSSKPITGAVVSVSQSGTEVATCTTLGNVATITRVATGSNYTSPPTVTITGKGTGAAATANMQLGTITRSAGGSGYANGTYTGLGTFTGGGGTGATFTFTVSGGVVQTTLTIVNRGSGYTSLPTPDFSAAGPGTGAALTVRLNVLSLILTAGGTGYLAATLAMTGGSGSGATGTATVASGCTLSAPADTYDVTVTPPTDSGYVAYSGTLVHTCGQTTSVSLDIDPDTACVPGCDCPTIPIQIAITFTFGGSYTGFHFPDSTLTWDAAHGWWASPVFDGPGGPTDPRQMFLSCQATFYELRSDCVPSGCGLGPFATAFFDPSITCAPFFIPNGRFIANASPTFGSWTGMGL